MRQAHVAQLQQAQQAHIAQLRQAQQAQQAPLIDFAPNPFTSSTWTYPAPQPPPQQAQPQPSQCAQQKEAPKPADVLFQLPQPHQQPATALPYRPLPHGPPAVSGTPQMPPSSAQELRTLAMYQQRMAAAQLASRPHPKSATAVFLDHSSAPRISTDTLISRALKAQYPKLELTVVQEYNCQLLAFAAAGHATVQQVADTDADPATLSWKAYYPPARRLDGGNGALGEQPIFSKYNYSWNGHEFTVYFFDGRDGASSYPMVRNYYILSPKASDANDLIMAAGMWSDELHEEILVFDQGAWTKSKELYATVRDAKWENVILDESMKKAVIEDHLSFFRSRDTYTGLKVPWKRGIIYYGPPGNGKTISIKATMNMLYRQTPEIPTLYVRTLVSYMGPEYSIRQIFAAARRYAPCYLVFEDLDTIVSDNVRSYFLNEVDGLKNNDGIFMVGSTNHLDRLDPGISKRPSRFDRKYFFPDPNFEQRVAYCHFWQKKLGNSDEIEFPDKLCKAIAETTDKFSFAYMQEAFVAALLAIASKSDEISVVTEAGTATQGVKKSPAASGSPPRPAAGSDNSDDDDWLGVESDDEVFSGDEDDDDNDDDDDGDDGGDDDLDKYILWVELKKQIAILRDGMEDQAALLSAYNFFQLS
ncbi:P-loop containing nucleoside triphosphate hydrolase protein [Coniochaeta sp. 2T2.1]|nr:P-loop containing nucleoside triphosphate hydrolase protein [Coniochaeta sp. 2T2.1]